MPTDFYAHSSPLKNPPPDGWQPLAVHLREVARLAEQFARQMELLVSGDEVLQRHFRDGFQRGAHMAGLLHDLGKYRPEFQLMIRNGHPKNQRTWHKQAGAAHAATQKRLDLVFAILGHHGGLPDREGIKDGVNGESGAPVAQQIWGDAVLDCPELAEEMPAWTAGNDPLLLDLLTRFLFSCLVDADWQDTGRHAREVKELPPEPEVPPLDAALMLGCVLEYIRQRAAQCPDRRIADIRKEILDASLTAATEKTGLFSLTVPTGGGKTLSGLAFALAQAAKHHLRRIIYVAPYLSILEQNAREIRRALGVDDESPVVFEHHSLAEPPADQAAGEAEQEAAVRRAENWESPVVVTTNVQFFESLFSHKPGQCRKLHNIAGSVVILDECQTLPPDLISPTCSMLGQLAAVARCSIVLCTATQPAWNKRADLPDGLDSVREIIPPDLNLFQRLRRVHVSFPRQRGDALDWSKVAEEMKGEPAALCIVNTRRAAREVFRKLRELGCDDALHLSTTMCPAHRLEVIDEVHRRLQKKRPCRLVSTQLIECGCDVDFPLVLREMAPLEAIIQSAGRCNREGLLNASDGTPGGRVVVFRSPEGKLPPDRWYRAGRDKVEQDFLANRRTQNNLCSFLTSPMPPFATASRPIFLTSTWNSTARRSMLPHEFVPSQGDAILNRVTLGTRGDGAGGSSTPVAVPARSGCQNRGLSPR